MTAQFPESYDSKSSPRGDELTTTARPAAFIPCASSSGDQEADLLADREVDKPSGRFAPGGLVAFNPDFAESPSTSPLGSSGRSSTGDSSNGRPGQAPSPSTYNKSPMIPQRSLHHLFDRLVPSRRSFSGSSRGSQISLPSGS